MHIEDFREYCLSKKSSSEDTPFGPDMLVFRVSGKIFALTSLDQPQFRANLKCEPDYAIELREKYDFIIPGFHMNKRHWNTVFFENVNLEFAKSLIDHSYDRVILGLSKKERELL